MAAKNSKDDGGTYGHLIEDDASSIPETHRKFENFPAGVECKLDITDLPDDEDEYGWTTHYEEDSRKRTNPDVTDEIVSELLRTGVVWKSPNDDWDDRYLVQKQIDGIEWTIVVADDQEYITADNEDELDRWVLITVFSNYHGSVGTTNKYFDRLRERRDE